MVLLRLPASVTHTTNQLPLLLSGLVHEIGALLGPCFIERDQMKPSSFTGVLEYIHTHTHPRTVQSRTKHLSLLPATLKNGSDTKTIRDASWFWRRHGLLQDSIWTKQPKHMSSTQANCRWGSTNTEKEPPGAPILTSSQITSITARRVFEAP